MGKPAYRIGIDLGGTKIRTAVARGNDIVAEVRLSTAARSSKKTVLENICRSVELACGIAGIAPSDLAGIGIGVPGPIDYATGTVRLCPNIPSWRKVPVRDLLKKRFGCPVLVENDARAAALAEALLGAGKGYGAVFYTTVSTGIGGGIVIGGRIWHGAHGVAGEIGQTRLPDESVFESAAAGPAVKRLFGIAPEEIPARFAKGDPAARRALDHLARLIGVWLANVATLVDPDIIVVGGGLSNLGPCFLVPLRRHIRKNAFSEGAKVKVARAKLGDRSGVVGALLLGR